MFKLNKGTAFQEQRVTGCKPGGKTSPRQRSLGPNWGGVLIATLGLAALSCNAVLGTAQPAATQAETPRNTQPAAKPPTDMPVEEPTLTTEPAPTQADVLAPGATQVAAEDGMVQVYIPAGEFLMGATDAEAAQYFQENKVPLVGATPQHTVYLDAYWIDQTNVTNAMFQKFVEATNYKTDAETAGSGMADASSGEFVIVKGANWQHPHGRASNVNGLENHPVVQMSWNDAKAYCEWAGRRLPTEAEWEKAARGTDARKYPWGNDAPTCDQANYWGNAKGGCIGSTTAAVDKYPSGASPYGVLDMAGNVYEWVADWYGVNYYASSPERNPTGPETPSLASSRVLRGGSWANKANAITVVGRTSDFFQIGSVLHGFRCVH